MAKEREVTTRCRKHPTQSTNKKPTRLCEECWRSFIKAMDYYKWEADVNREWPGR